MLDCRRPWGRRVSLNPSAPFTTPKYHVLVFSAAGAQSCQCLTSPSSTSYFPISSQRRIAPRARVSSLRRSPQCFRCPSVPLCPCAVKPPEHDALRGAFFILPDKGLREAELMFADGHLYRFAFGNLEHSSVRKTLIFTTTLPAEANCSQ